MRKNIKKYLVVATIVALPLVTLACARTYVSNQIEKAKRKELINFIEYCKTCENLRQVNPAKDFTKASLHELKSAARFYEEQPDFADCTDYPQQIVVDDIIGVKYNARVNNNK